MFNTGTSMLTNPTYHECYTVVCSAETDVPSERRCTVEAIPIGARETRQPTAVSSQGVCLWNAATQVSLCVVCCLFQVPYNEPGEMFTCHDG